MAFYNAASEIREYRPVSRLGDRRRSKRQPTHPFLAQSQRDFAARFFWATPPRYADANHAPRIAIKGSRLISAKPGQTVVLAVNVSDPDHDKVAVRWRTWPEAGTYAGDAALSASEGLSTKLVVPDDAKPGDTLHIVAEAIDDGAPALIRYARHRRDDRQTSEPGGGVARLPPVSRKSSD